MVRVRLDDDVETFFETVEPQTYEVRERVVVAPEFAEMADQDGCVREFAILRASLAAFVGAAQ